jgi:hypothetical protein
MSGTHSILNAFYTSIIQELLMDARIIRFSSIAQAHVAIDRLGSGNTPMMASRAIHINILLKRVPGPEAKSLKTAYNEIGAEAAISSSAYNEEDGAITDMIVMGTLYQHREVRRILMHDTRLAPWITEIRELVENAEESQE